MERLTKNEDVLKMSMYELAHNSCYIGENYEAMIDYLQYEFDTIEGLIAVFYRNL